MERKPDLRRRLLARREALPPEEAATLSARAGAHLFATPEMARARTLLFFVSFGSEIQTIPLMARARDEGKQVAAPRVERGTRELVPHVLGDLNADLAPGAYGILEPRPEAPRVPLDEIEVVIVPGVAWSEDGLRVGYGGGYYDHFLPTVPAARRVGLAYELQVVPSVPHNRKDVPRGLARDGSGRPQVFNSGVSMDYIRIAGLEVFGHHGVTAEEQAVGRAFSIDVEVRCDLREAGARDELTATVDYGAICQLVAEVNETGPYRLLEAFAERIAKEVLARFTVQDVTVRVRKPHPPVGLVVQATEVEITRGS